MIEPVLTGLRCRGTEVRYWCGWLLCEEREDEDGAMMDRQGGVGGWPAFDAVQLLLVSPFLSRVTVKKKTVDARLSLVCGSAAF